MISLHGIFLGMSHIGVEKKNKTMDFIFVKPLSKRGILKSKVFAGFTIILIVNAIVSMGTIISINYLGNVSDKFITRMIISFLLTDFFFYSLGVLISVISKKKKFGGIGASVFFLFYLLAILSRISDKISGIEFTTPFEILSGSNVIYGFKMMAIIALPVLSIVLLVISVHKINGKEVL